MTIENPQTHRTGEQGGVMPPEQQAWKGPDTDTEFPQQRGQTSPDTYQIPEQKDEEEPGFLSRHWGKVALATAGVVAAGAYYLSHGASHDSAPTNIPDTGSKPVATAEQHPGGSSPVTSVEAQSSTPETSADTGVSFGAQHMTIETAKATLFEVSQGKAPSAGEAAKQWGVALQNGMKMNASRDAVSQGGGAQAVEKENLDLLTGADGILLGLGKDHNSISEAGADFMQPATLVYLTNKDNVENETFSRVYLTNTRVTGSDADGYTVLGDLTVTTMRGEEALSSKGYKAEVHEKLNPQTKKWDYSGSHVLKDNG